MTLTSARPWPDTDDTAATGISEIDLPLRGGVRRGHLSEIVGAPSSGRTTVLCSILTAATARGEVVALIDTCDRFDPLSASAAGMDLSRLLWIRESGNAGRALKAMNLIVQAGGFGIVAFDLADLPGASIRQFPCTTWMRIARVIEGSETAAVLIGSERIGRSPGGVTIALDTRSDAPRGTWYGGANRARFLSELHVHPRIVSAR